MKFDWHFDLIEIQIFPIKDISIFFICLKIQAKSG